jgi:hypothetical protein
MRQLNKDLSRREFLEERLRLLYGAVVLDGLNRKYIDMEIRKIEEELVDYILLDVEDKDE